MVSGRASIPLQIHLTHAKASFGHNKTRVVHAKASATDAMQILHHA